MEVLAYLVMLVALQKVPLYSVPKSTKLISPFSPIPFGRNFILSMLKKKNQDD
jgi:hypothetical protein